MIRLRSGNFAISNKNKIEIYDFSKLNYENEIKVFDNKLIKKNECLIQEIYPEKENKYKNVNYVFEFKDGILLCSAFSKIIIVKLTNNDTEHEVIGHINLRESELTRKIISLKEDYLILLNEHYKNCNIKLIKISKKNHQTIIHDNNIEIIKSYDFDILDEISTELFVSIFEIKNDKLKKNDDNIYLYEFIATSNATYKLGKDIVIFYGIKNDKIKKIKVISGISCSVEPESICQLNDNIICIGLQKYKKKTQEQVNGFALIDIYKRELHNIIRDHDVSSLYYYKQNNLLLASTEILGKGIDYFSTNIYKIIENKDDKGNNIIELKKAYEYKNITKNIVISINKVLYPCKGFIFVTCSDLCDLEVVKTDLNNEYI